MAETRYATKWTQLPAPSTLEKDETSVCLSSYYWMSSSWDWYRDEEWHGHMGMAKGFRLGHKMQAEDWVR